MPPSGHCVTPAPPAHNQIYSVISIKSGMNTHDTSVNQLGIVMRQLFTCQGYSRNFCTPPKGGKKFQGEPPLFFNFSPFLGPLFFIFFNIQPSPTFKKINPYLVTTIVNINHQKIPTTFVLFITFNMPRLYVNTPMHILKVCNNHLHELFIKCRLH